MELFVTVSSVAGLAGSELCGAVQSAVAAYHPTEAFVEVRRAANASLCCSPTGTGTAG